MTLGWRHNAAIERLLEEDEFVLKGGDVLPTCAISEDDLDDDLEDLAKSERDIDEIRPIGGFCSTARLDRQGEEVIQKGLDFSEFVNFGYFNDNHKQDTHAVLGFPRLAVMKNGKWYTEGNIIKGYEPADKVWLLAKALKASDAPRRLGFSIEGKILERDNKNKILRAVVRHVAITNSPVNTDCTWDILSKAFSDPYHVNQASKKALTAGHGQPHAGGSALRRESVEGVTRKSILSTADVEARFRQLRPEYSDEIVHRLARLAVHRMKGA